MPQLMTTTCRRLRAGPRRASSAAWTSPWRDTPPDTTQTAGAHYTITIQAGGLVQRWWFLDAEDLYKQPPPSTIIKASSSHLMCRQHVEHLQVFLTLSHYVRRHACMNLRGIEERWGRKHIYRCTAFLNAKHFYDSYIISIPGLRSVPSLYVIFLPLFYIRHIIVYWKTI